MVYISILKLKILSAFDNIFKKQLKLPYKAQKNNFKRRGGQGVP